MFTRGTRTIWIGILLLSSMFLMGEEPAWSPSDLFYCEDMDGDGYGVRPAFLCPYFLKIDCDDSNPAVHPGVIEAGYGDPICSDGLDNDCDGLTDLDDNQCQECSLAVDCDDGDPCTDDACVDFACSYTYNPDADQDGYAGEICGGPDCDDQNPQVNPGATEGPAGNGTCSDEQDNDCDGATDGADPDCAA